MNNRQNLIATLEGRKSECIPYSFWDNFPIPAADRTHLYTLGLCVTGLARVCRETMHNVERIVQTFEWRGRQAEAVTLRTPVGELRQVTADNWIQEYFLKSPADYRVMEYVVRDTTLEPAYQQFNELEERLGSSGLALVLLGRSPLQTMLVDYVGLERFALHLMDSFPEFDGLYEALLDQLIAACRIAAAGPGHYVNLLENLTAEAWGPRRFARYHTPVYRRVVPILHDGGKKVFAHCDGKLRSIARLLGEADLDGIESFTLAPEGDMSYEEARQAWPSKLIWSNIGLRFYDLPEKELRASVRRFVEAACSDGTNLAFEISEDLPRQWRETIPVILDELNEIGL